MLNNGVGLYWNASCWRSSHSRKPFKCHLISHHTSSFWFWRNVSFFSLCVTIFFCHSKESRPQAFAEAVNKVSHLSATRKLCMDYISQELTNSQLLWCFSTLTALSSDVCLKKTFHLSRPRLTVLFFNRDSQRQPVSHVDLLPPTVLFLIITFLCDSKHTRVLHHAVCRFLYG